MTSSFGQAKVMGWATELLPPNAIDDRTTAKKILVESLIIRVR